MSDERPASLEDAARIEQYELWFDLAEVIDLTTVWQLRHDGLAARICGLAHFVGATPWGQVPTKLLRYGTYERVLRDAGIAFEPIDWERVARAEQRVAARNARFAVHGVDPEDLVRLSSPVITGRIAERLRWAGLSGDEAEQ